MTFRPLVLAIAPVFALATAATAHAQAPGEVETSPEYAQPPDPVAPNPCSASSVAINPMAHRWAIAIGFGAFTVAPEDAPEGSEAKFRNSEIALRYRASRRIELELALSGGRQVLEDDQEGDLANGSVIFSARYRFMPERKWNWWLGAGLGGTVIADHTSDEEARDAAQRPVMALGVGVERRFRRFAIQAELKSLAIGARKDQEQGKDVPVGMTTTPPADPKDPNGGGMDQPPPPDVNPLPPDPIRSEPEKLHGGSFTINLSYYF